MQDAAYSSLTNTIPVETPGLNDALVSLDPRSGRVLSMAQNTTYGIEAGETMSNYSADGNFQVGSTFKVFTLLQWFKEGHRSHLRDGRFGEHLLPAAPSSTTAAPSRPRATRSTTSRARPAP